MTAATFDFIKDMLFLAFFYVGAAWMWGLVKLDTVNQQKLELIFKRSRGRFKWLFLIGALALTGLFVWQYLIKA